MRRRVTGEHDSPHCQHCGESMSRDENYCSPECEAEAAAERKSDRKKCWVCWREIPEGEQVTEYLRGLYRTVHERCAVDYGEGEAMHDTREEERAARGED